jgi:hypothetical protein
MSAEVQKPPPETTPTRRARSIRHARPPRLFRLPRLARPVGPSGVGPSGVGLRLVRLYLVSRRVPAALAVLAACAAVLRIALHWHWGAGGQPLPLVIEAAAAAAIAVTTAGPFGEPERATGRWLPYLRLGAAIALTAAAVGALAAAAAAAHLPGGTLDTLRSVAGLVGIGLLSAAVLGGGLSWVGPMAYLLVAEYALTAHSTTPWAWPARPPHDLGAALCAALIFAAGAATIAVRGARESAHE